MSRAAGPQCQHVRGMPWSLCLTGGTSVSGALCLGMDQGAWCRWTVRVACLWPFAASSRMLFGVCNCSSDSYQFIHQCDQNFNDSQMYISAVNFLLVFMFSVRRQMSPVSTR